MSCLSNFENSLNVLEKAFCVVDLFLSLNLLPPFCGIFRLASSSSIAANFPSPFKSNWKDFSHLAMLNARKSGPGRKWKCCSSYCCRLRSVLTSLPSLDVVRQEEEGGIAYILMHQRLRLKMHVSQPVKMRRIHCEMDLNLSQLLIRPAGCQFIQKSKANRTS